MTKARILADYVDAGDELALKAPLASPTFTGITTTPSLVVTPGSAPATTEGSMYYDSGSDVVKVYNGSSWNTISNFPYKTAGGIVTSYTSGSDTYIVHTFLETGKFFVHSSTTIDYLIVGGGGGGGGDMGSGNNGNAGGGGAGGMLVATSYSIAVGEYLITVGAGGPNSKTVNGASSSIGSLFEAHGGGHGGSYAGDTNTPGSGDGTVGSAGGQGQGGSTTAGFTGTPAQGNFGSPWTGNNNGYGGGGGGGAGSAGFEQTGTNGSTGGNGGSALGNAFRTGMTQYYAGGGAGSTHDAYNTGGLGGNTRDFLVKGGGADGKWGQGGGHGVQGGAVWASNGLPNTGGGGGGGEGGGSGAANGQRSGDGGSGIVVIRYIL